MWPQPKHTEYECKVLSTWEIRANIPKRFSDISFAEKFTEGFSVPEFNQSCFYWGGVGTGKSTFGCYILYKLAMQCVQDSPGGMFPGLYLPCVELYENLKDCYSGSTGRSAESVLRDYSNVPYLVLDDMGAEKQTDWVLEKLYILLDRRYRDMLPTIFLSNLSIATLHKSVGSRAVRRICDVVGENVFELREYNKIRQADEL